MSAVLEPEPDPSQPCCDWRNHGSLGELPPMCLCPEHPLSDLHPFGWSRDLGDDPPTLLA